MPPKKDQHSSPSQKTISLYCQLMFTGSRFSLSQLSREHRCSKPTIGRMIEQIERSFGGPVHSEIVGKEKFYWMPKPKQRPNVSLTPQEIQELDLCRGMVMHLLPETTRERLRHTIAKTTTLLPDMEVRAEAFSTIATAEIKGQIDYSPHNEHIQTLIQAIQGNVVCELSYQSPRRSKPKTYPFAPTKLLSYKEALYVTGWRVQSRGTPSQKHEIMFAVHRIKDVSMQSRTFNFDTDHESAEKPFGLMDLEEFRIKVKFDKEMATYIKERNWSHDQSIHEYKNGNIVLEFTAQSMPEVLCWILGFGSHAKVMKPVELKRQVEAEIKCMMERYAKRSV